MSAAPRLAEAEIPVDPVQGLDELPYGFIAVGFDLTISYASHGAHELLGYEPGDLVGRSAVDRLDPDDFDRILGLFEQLTDDADRRRTEPSSARHVELSLRLLDGHFCQTNLLRRGPRLQQIQLRLGDGQIGLRDPNLSIGRLPLRLPAWVVLGLWIGAQIVSVAIASPDDEVAWWAHIGGLVAGAVLIVFMKRRGVPLFDRGMA